MRTLALRFKAQANWSWVALPLVLAFLSLITFGSHPRERHAQDWYGIAEFFLPVAAAFFAAGLPVFDREQEAAELHLSYAHWPSLRLLGLGLGRLGVWLAMAGAVLAVAAIWYLPMTGADLWAAAGVAAAPSFALGAAAAAGAAGARHQAGGLLIAAAWWLIDLIMPGRITRYIYLFRICRPMGVVAPEVHTRNLWLFGLLLWALTLWLAHRRERWVR